MITALALPHGSLRAPKSDRLPARKTLDTFRQRIRQITGRSGGRSLPEIAGRLRAYLPDRKAYVQLAQTPKVFRGLDAWIRHRSRAVQLKHGRRGPTMYRELKAMGASGTDARKVAATAGAGGVTAAWR